MPTAQSAAQSATASTDQRLLDLITASGFVGIDELARRFEVTPQTIRRRVNQLCEQGLLRRVHGGVSVPALNANLPYTRRQVQNLAAKQRIAAAVAEHIPDGCSVSIGLGTTPEQVALALRARRDLRVITNSINVVNALAGRADIELTMAGGALRTHDLDVIGSAAARCFSAFRTDFAIFGVGGIDDDGSLLDFETGEVVARRAMVDNSRQALLVVDTSKFGRRAIVRGGHVADVGHVFVDAAPPQGYARLFAGASPVLHIGLTHIAAHSDQQETNS